MKGNQMEKFKVGDRVKDISTYYSFSPAGLGTVIAVEGNGDFCDVKLDNSVYDYEDKKNWYFPIWTLSPETPEVDRTKEIDMTINISDTEEIDVIYENIELTDLPDLLKAIKVVFPKATSAVFVVNL